MTSRCVMVWSDLMTLTFPLLTAQPHCVDNEPLDGNRKLIKNEKRQGMATNRLLRVYMNSPALFTDEAEQWYKQVALRARSDANEAV